MRFVLLAFIALIILSGCTKEDITRLEKVVEVTQEKVEQAEDALKAATNALADAQAASDAILGKDKLRIIEQTQQAVAIANDALAAAKATATAASTTLDAAKKANEAGGSTVDTVLAGIMAFLTGSALAIPAIIKAVNTGKALVQTVRGLDTARDALGEAEWKTKVAPNLASEQDKSTKLIVKKLQI